MLSTLVYLNTFSYQNEYVDFENHIIEIPKCLVLELEPIKVGKIQFLSHDLTIRQSKISGK